MPFPNKGENHTIGIKNEKDTIHYLNNDKINSISNHLSNYYSSKITLFKHEGGTKQKRDASCILENGEIKGISIKNHGSGTFDWVNTTTGIPEPLKIELNEFKRNNHDKPIPKKGGIRDEYNNILAKYLNQLTNDNILTLLSKISRTEKDTD